MDKYFQVIKMHWSEISAHIQKKKFKTANGLDSTILPIDNIVLKYEELHFKVVGMLSPLDGSGSSIFLCADIGKNHFLFTPFWVAPTGRLNPNDQMAQLCNWALNTLYPTSDDLRALFLGDELASKFRGTDF